MQPISKVKISKTHEPSTYTLQSIGTIGNHKERKVEQTFKIDLSSN